MDITWLVCILLVVWSIFLMNFISLRLKVKLTEKHMKELLREIVEDAVATEAEKYLKKRIRDFLVEIGNNGKIVSLTWKEKENANVSNTV